MFDVEANSDAVNELERQMRLSEDVIRFMTVKIDEVTEAPSPMMSRRDRDDRRRSRDDREDDMDGGSDDERGQIEEDSVDTSEEENS